MPKITVNAPSPADHPRHLLVFLDGTWNDENGKENDGLTTNIYKLFDALEGDRHPFTGIPMVKEHAEHLALYFRGIGNDDDNSMAGTFFKGAFGGSEKRIRDSAYCAIVKHYRKGDHISIFGFSRGAASARMLAGDIAREGIANNITVHFDTEENKSTKVEEEVFKKYSAKGEAHHRPKVNFLGIFDTVGAFGIPINIGFGFQKINLFKDLGIHPHVEKVVHCVSIDESREPFIPTLCNKRDGVDEVFFAGVHSDIGGGYRQNQLSAIPTKYMLQQLDKHYSHKPINFNQHAVQKLQHYDLTRDEFMIHHHGDGFAKARRAVHVIENDEPTTIAPKIHESVFSLMDSKHVYVSTTTDSYDKIDSVRYCPKSVSGLMGNYIKVT